MINSTKSFEEVKDIFQAHLNTQHTILNYPKQLLHSRSTYIKWIIEICQKLHFKKETLHRTIFLFDLFATKSNPHNLEDYRLIKLTVIACLSIATKLNELDNNCVKFFTHNILNNSSQKHKYTIQDLIEKEIEILNEINYETNYSNVYHFNAIFSHVVLDNLDSAKEKMNYEKINEKAITQFVLTDYCVSMSPINSAIFILNKTFQCFDLPQLSRKKIVESIETLDFKQQQ